MTLGREGKRVCADVIWKAKNSFTLLEIVICMAILSLASVAIGWQAKGLLAVHHFQKDLSYLLTDLKCAQLVALSNRVDIELRLQKVGNTYCYQLHTEEPLPAFVKRVVKLKGIEEIRKGKKPIESYTFTVYASGRISPTEEISFLQKKGREVIWNLQKTPWIQIIQK